MSAVPITRACASFLAEHEIDFERIAGTPDHLAPRDNRHRYRRLQLQGPSRHCPIPDGDEFNQAVLEHDPGSGNTLLTVKRKTFWYREYPNGLAELAIFKRQLPETLCLGIYPDRYRLKQIVVDDGESFLFASDPLVRSLANQARLGWPAIVLILRPVWAVANWNYGSADKPKREKDLAPLPSAERASVGRE